MKHNHPAVKLTISAIVATVLAGVAGQALAVTVVDLDTTDLNSIIRQEHGDHTNYIFEDYNETGLLPYRSHDGYGIVDPTLDPNDPDHSVWFNKQVFKDGATGIWTLNFVVYNSGPYTWSDYHIELGSTAPLVGWSNASGGINGAFFQNSALDGAVISWWAPGWQAQTQTQQFSVTLNLDNMDDGFYIRQVATTVPLPPALWLLGSGLLGLIGVARCKTAT